MCCCDYRLQFVKIISKVWVTRFQSLPCLGGLDNLVRLGALLEWISGENLPVVKHTLREGLASGVGSQVSGEAEWLVDRQVGLDNKHGGSWGLGLLEHVASPSVQHTVDSSNSVFRTLKRKYFKNIQNIWVKLGAALWQVVVSLDYSRQRLIGLELLSKLNNGPKTKLLFKFQKMITRKRGNS